MSIIFQFILLISSLVIFLIIHPTGDSLFPGYVQRPGMVALQYVAEHATPEQVQWFGEVALDAMCQSLTGCEEGMWATTCTLAVMLANQVHGPKVRGKW